MSSFVRDLLAKMVRSKPASSKSKTAKLESAVTAAESSSHEVICCFSAVLLRNIEEASP